MPSLCFETKSIIKEMGVSNNSVLEKPEICREGQKQKSLGKECLLISVYVVQFLVMPHTTATTGLCHARNHMRPGKCPTLPNGCKIPTGGEQLPSTQSRLKGWVVWCAHAGKPASGHRLAYGMRRSLGMGSWRAVALSMGLPRDEEVATEFPFPVRQHGNGAFGKSLSDRHGSRQR